MASVNDKIHIAILGCGAVARVHAKSLASLRDEARFSFASRDPQNAAEYRERFGGVASFGRYEDALDAPEVDAVLVTTPPASHLELTVAALRAGKDVIVEKPAFLRVADFGVVRRAAAESGRRVFVAENYHYKPVLRVVRESIARGDVGDLLFVHVNALKSQRTSGWRDDLATSGGGALFEGGIHWIDFLASLGLEIRSVRGQRPRAADGGAERSMLVSFDYAEGAVGALFYSWEVPSIFRGLRLSRVYGRAGSITFESNGLFVAVRGARKRLVVPGLADIAGYRAMMRDFVRALRTGAPAEMTLDMAERDVALVEEAYRTAEEAERTPSSGVTARGEQRAG